MSAWFSHAFLVAPFPVALWGSFQAIVHSRVHAPPLKQTPTLGGRRKNNPVIVPFLSNKCGRSSFHLECVRVAVKSLHGSRHTLATNKCS